VLKCVSVSWEPDLMNKPSLDALRGGSMNADGS
jgi:hypothetical protein